MKRTLSFFLSLFMTASLLVALLPASSASAAKDEPVSEPWESFDALPEDPFSGSYTEFDGKDGTKTRVYENGGVMTKYKDGSETSVDYQGNCYTTAPDGSYSVRTADGCSATAYSDGRQSWTTPDGKTTTVNPDGSSSETFARDYQHSDISLLFSRLEYQNLRVGDVPYIAFSVDGLSRPRPKFRIKLYYF